MNSIQEENEFLFSCLILALLEKSEFEIKIFNTRIINRYEEGLINKDDLINVLSWNYLQLEVF